MTEPSSARARGAGIEVANMFAFGVKVPPRLVRVYSSGVSKREALDQLVDAVLWAGVVLNPAPFRDAVHEREAIMSTGIGTGIAIPHVRVADVLKPTVGVGISREGIDFGTLDDAPVHIVVFFAMPSGAHREYLLLLARAMTSLKTAGFRDALLGCTSAEAAATLLNTF